MNRLEARAVVQNGRGNGALRKLGAVQEGVLRGSLLKDGKYLDQIMWSIVAKDWYQAKAVWDLLVFVLNGVIFVLIGLQLRAIRDAGLIESPGLLFFYGAVISAVAIVIRLVWVPPAPIIPRATSAPRMV